MASKIVDIYWGSAFEHRLRLNTPENGGFAFRSTTVDLASGPEQEVVIGETEYSVPFDIRGKLQPRAFSIIASPMGGPASVAGQGFIYDPLWQRRKHEMFKACYSGLVRVVIQRFMLNDRNTVDNIYMYITARCDGIKEIERGIFEISFTAADPIFTQVPPGVETVGVNIAGYNPSPGEPPSSELLTDWKRISIHTGSPSASNPSARYTRMPPSPPENTGGYPGSAPTEPVITFEVRGAGNVWRYRRDFSITNNSSQAWVNQACCIDLGQVFGVGKPLQGKARGDLGDIRIETYGGARKVIYVRPHDNAGGHSGNYAKVWFVVHSLAPGETKYFRLLYGNAAATAEDENGSVKPMMNMYTSTNAQWIYSDFLPRIDQPQSRIGQWVPHVPGRQNITWINAPHPDFTAPSSNTLVNAAGGRATWHGTGAGYAAVQLTTPIAIASVVFDHRTRTNYKAPFVMRSQRPDGTYIDDYADGTGTGNRSWAQHSHAAGLAYVDVSDQNLASAGWIVGDNIGITLDNGTTHSTTVTSVGAWNGTYSRIGITAAIPAGRSVPTGAAVYQNPTGRAFGNVTQSYSTGNEPRLVAFGIRVDYPTAALGEWFYAGVDNATINFLSSEVPSVKWRKTASETPTTGFTGTSFIDTEAVEFDMNSVTNGYQLIGRFQNDQDGKGIRVNTIMDGVRDRLVVDCEKRTCLYYKWDITAGRYLAAENRYEALYFEEVRDYWLRLVPEQSMEAVRFVHDAQSNFRNIQATIRWAVRYY